MKYFSAILWHNCRRPVGFGLSSVAYTTNMSAPPRRDRRPRWPLSAQIIALLFGSLIVAQAATLCLTLVLPPAPAPQYSVSDIAEAIRGDVKKGGPRPLTRSISAEPPSSQTPGWLVSDRARKDLARMLGADEADVRLLFYTPLPFAGAAAPARPHEELEPEAEPARVEPAAWDWQTSGDMQAGFIKTAYDGGPPAGGAMGPPGVGGGLRQRGFGDGQGPRVFNGDDPAAPRFDRSAAAPTGLQPSPGTLLRGGPMGRGAGVGDRGTGGFRPLPGAMPGGMIRRDGAAPTGASPADRVQRWVAPSSDRFASPERTFGPLPSSAAQGARTANWPRAAGQATPSASPSVAASAGPGEGAQGAAFRGLAAQTEGPAAGALAPQAVGPRIASQQTAAPGPAQAAVPAAGQGATQAVTSGAAPAPAPAAIRGRWIGATRVQSPLDRDTLVARFPQQDRPAPRTAPPPRPAVSPAAETTTAAVTAPPAEAPLRLDAQAPPAALDRALPGLSRGPSATAAAAPAAAVGGFAPSKPVARGLFGLAPAPFIEGDFVAAYREAPGRWIVVRPTPEPFPNSWQRRVLLWFALSLAVVAPLGYLFARSLTTPLTDFVKAAEHIGRDPSASVLVMEGPAEVGRAGRAFNQMQRRLKRFVDDRAAVVSALSHDLRAPLLRMRFRAEKAPPEIKAGMLHEVAQMEDMISSVLAFMRDVSESGPRESVDLRSVLECVIDDVAMTGGDAVLDPGDDVLVEADVQGVRRALTNLVENAVKYGERAHARLYVDEGEAVVEIVDRGPGVPETELERVFQPFYRTDDARSSNKSGVGLGLVSARSMVRAHGGDVQLRNSDTGLIAQVRLPLPREAA